MLLSCLALWLLPLTNTASAQPLPQTPVFWGTLFTDIGPIKLPRGPILPDAGTPDCIAQSSQSGFIYTTAFILDEANELPVLYVCDVDSGTWSPISGSDGGGGGSGDQTLGEVTALGRIVLDAIDESEGVRFGAPADYIILFHDTVTDRPTIKGYCNGSECPSLELTAVAGGSVAIIKPDGTPIFTCDIDSSICTHPHKGYIWYGSQSWQADGTTCQPPEEISFTDIPTSITHMFYGTRCTSVNAGGVFHLPPLMLSGALSIGDAVDVKLVASTTDPSPSGTSLDMNVVAKCESTAGGGVIDFGSPVAARIGLVTMHAKESIEVSVTPGGTCGPFSMLWIQLQMLAATGDNDADLTKAWFYGAGVLPVNARITSE